MARAAKIRGLSVRPSRFRWHDAALWHGTHELAHCHNGQADIRLTRAVVRELRDELRMDARMDLRRTGTDWILIRLRVAADVDRALELVRRALRADRTIGA